MKLHESKLAKNDFALNNADLDALSLLRCGLLNESFSLNENEKHGTHFHLVIRFLSPLGDLVVFI